MALVMTTPLATWEYFIVVPIGVLMALLVVMIFGTIALRWWGPWQMFSCWFGWHSWPSFDPTSHDGASQHARCKWCGGEGMIDSQGNLFGVKRVDDA